ncbi:hypothetical protein vseg_016344 [Gypsophila vaccaria]
MLAALSTVKLLISSNDSPFEVGLFYFSDTSSNCSCMFYFSDFSMERKSGRMILLSKGNIILVILRHDYKSFACEISSLDVQCWA